MSKVVQLPLRPVPEAYDVPESIGLIAEHLLSLRDLALMSGHAEVAHFIDVAAGAAVEAEATAGLRRKGEEH